MTSFGGRLTGTILIVAALGLLLAGAAGARPTLKVIGTGTLLKGGLYAYAQANALGPTSIFARVTTTPSQKVFLQWSITCSKRAPAAAVAGQGAYDASTASKSGQRNVTSPATTTIPLPFAYPKSCSVSLYAKLVKKATTKIQILQS